MANENKQKCLLNYQIETNLENLKNYYEHKLHNNEDIEKFKEELKEDYDEIKNREVR